MPHEYKLSLIKNDTSEKITLSGEFADKEWELLEEFHQCAVDLLNTRFVKDSMPSSLEIKWHQGSAMEFKTQLPPWDDVRAFLHTFRPIGLQSERTYFYNLCAVLEKQLVHSYIRDMMGNLRKIYNGQILQTMNKIQIYDVIINSDKVLFAWLNSYEYHRDKNKRNFIDDIQTEFPPDASKAIFLSLLAEKTRAIINLTCLIRVILGKQITTITPVD